MNENPPIVDQGTPKRMTLPRSRSPRYFKLLIAGILLLGCQGKSNITAEISPQRPEQVRRRMNSDSSAAAPPGHKSPEIQDLSAACTFEEIASMILKSKRYIEAQRELLKDRLDRVRRHRAALLRARYELAYCFQDAKTHSIRMHQWEKYKRKSFKDMMTNMCDFFNQANVDVSTLSSVIPKSPSKSVGLPTLESLREKLSQADALYYRYLIATMTPDTDQSTHARSIGNLEISLQLLHAEILEKEIMPMRAPRPVPTQ
jgi:hypothetical protein